MSWYSDVVDGMNAPAPAWFMLLAALAILRVLGQIRDYLEALADSAAERDKKGRQ